MQAEDRLVHFSTELFHRPAQHSRAALQKVYYELSRSKAAAYDNIDFSQPPIAKLYSRRGKRSQSLALFLPDRLVLVEEWADTPLESFLDKLQEVGRQALNGLGLTAFTTQTAVLRATFALTHFDDARAFLMDHVCQQESRIGPHFQRPIATAGLRFSLPQTPEHPGNMNVIIESFRHDPKEVLVEVKGTYTKLELDIETLGQASENIAACRRFISESIFPFLNQYDTPKEGLV